MRPAVSGLYTTLMIIRQYLAIITDITHLKAHRISDRHGLRGVFQRSARARTIDGPRPFHLRRHMPNCGSAYQPNRAFCHVPRDITSLHVSQPQSHSRDDCFPFASDDSSAYSLQLFTGSDLATLFSAHPRIWRGSVRKARLAGQAWSKSEALAIGRQRSVPTNWQNSFMFEL